MHFLVFYSGWIYMKLYFKSFFMKTLYLYTQAFLELIYNHDQRMYFIKNFTLF